MNIIEFMESPALTPGSFEGDSWEPAKAVLSGAFGLPMDANRLELFKALAGGREAPTSRVREFFWIAGRRSSKTNNAAGIATYMATIGAELFGLLDKLKPGERGVVNIIAVDRPQAKVAFSYIAGMFDASPVLSGMVTKRTADSIDLNNRVSIEVNTNSFKSVRGRTAICTILDECAFFKDEASASPDVELYRACIPALATTGGMLLGISSPWAKKGLLYQKYRKHFAQDSDVLVVQGSTEQFNPTIDRRIIADAFEEDPEGSKSEWGGQFRDGISDFITREALDAVTRAAPLIRPYDRRFKFVGFADPAGGGQSANADEFTLAIGHHEDGVLVIDRVDAARGVPAEITERFAGILSEYGVKRINLDRFAGSWPSDEFEKHGIKCEHSPKTRSELYIDSLQAITSGRVEFPPDEKMIRQWQNLERRTARSGRETVDHPPGQHEDRANAAAGLIALHGQKKRMKTSEWL
ncbi:hypothetical protein [Halomonas stenophila]|uniref:Terminase n=1 Tax=Halomonas stenophila TaxID=795312 RepID=A0A7W5ET93_9GAMM|nr:hypothetical protein [Halomonas stenophila]MBB3231064.1 hypothetical protein [Halomonas stenophila]